MHIKFTVHIFILQTKKINAYVLVTKQQCLTLMGVIAGISGHVSTNNGP